MDIEEFAAEAYLLPEQVKHLMAKPSVWVHGSVYGRAHRSLRLHLLEDHGLNLGAVKNLSDAGLRGLHDGDHGEVRSSDLDLYHGQFQPGRPIEGRYVVLRKDRPYRFGPGDRGPAWQRAGLALPGRPFYSRRFAQRVAERLSRHSSAEFVAIPYREKV